MVLCKVLRHLLLTLLDGTVYTETLAAYNAATTATAIDTCQQRPEGLAVGDHWELDDRTVNGVNCPGVTNDIMLGRGGLVLTQLSISNMVDWAMKRSLPALIDIIGYTVACWIAGVSYNWVCVHRDGGINILS